MKQYLNQFMEKFDYPSQAQECLNAAYEQIAACPEANEAFEALINAYEQNCEMDFKAAREQMKEIIQKAGIHEYTGMLLLFICLSRGLKQYYANAGLKEEWWFTAMCDLKWKLMESWEIHGIWGTFVPEWYTRFFQLTRFAFGKLQFELIPFGKEYSRNGLTLTPESTVINVHIPRTGGRLEREGMLDAYRQAAEYFKDACGENGPVFVCRSWLLFPKNAEVLSPSSNLYAFFADYDVFEQGEYEDYTQVWRLFDQNYDGNVDHLPQNTSLRRAYADWIRKGEKTGWGYGVFAYDQLMETRYFGYQEEAAQNPFIGFTSFQHFRNEPLYSDVVVKPENNMRETENLEPYPVPAYVPQNGREEGYYPDSTVAYIRILWKEFEPRQGEYHYEVIEDVLQKAHECGQTVMFRLMPHSTRAEDDVPEWLKEIVDCPERPEGARMKDSPTDPEYLRLFGKAMEKIAERYDDDPRLDIVDICLPGAWGEGHKLERYSEEVLKEHMDVYTRAFKNTHLLGQVLSHPLVRYANNARPVGWRGDGIGQPKLMATTFEHTAGALPELWEKSPVSFESYWWLGEWKRQGWDLDQIIEATLKWHISTFNAKSVPVPFEWADKVNEWNRRMGYHYVIEHFTCQKAAQAGGQLQVAWGIDNNGVAPIYRRIPLMIRLSNGENEYTFETDTDIRTWMPGKHNGCARIALPEQMAPGRYKVEIGIMNEHFPAVYFATNAKRNGAWYAVGETVIC